MQIYVSDIYIKHLHQKFMESLTLITLIPFFSRGRLGGGDLDIAGLLGALIDLVLLIRVRIGSTELVAVGDEGPHEVHGGSGEGAAADAEEEADDDNEDVLSALPEGAEAEGGGGGLGRDDGGPAGEIGMADLDRAEVEIADGGGGVSGAQRSDDAVDGEESGSAGLGGLAGDGVAQGGGGGGGYGVGD